jgi:eukaryotic-like serine/threonine-protein kinase
LTGLWPAIAISPDGTRLVYAAGPNVNLTRLYVRAIDGSEARPIPGAERALYPFFSPDGQWVGFSAGGKLKKVSLAGGTPVSLADVFPLGVFGASWSSQGRIAFAPLLTGPIQQISDRGGNPQPLIRLDKGEVVQWAPEFLPGGNGLLFFAASTVISSVARTNGTVAVQSLVTGERRDLLQGQGLTIPRYAPSGHLVYLQGSNLMAAPFDPQRLTITGAAVPVIEGVQQSSQYSFSNTGSLVYVPGSVEANQLKLVWVDRRGAEQPVSAPPHNYGYPRISPDGERVALGIEEPDSQIWVYDLGRDTLTRLTFEQNATVGPIWTPDGKKIVFKGNQNRLFWQPADGSAPAEELTKAALTQNNAPGSFSPDGQVLAFMGSDPNTHLYTLQLKDSKPQPFVHTLSNETAPRFSPDGHFIAYASDESGRWEIYVRPYPGPGGKWQISTEGGTEAVWNPKGRELFYRSDNKMMAVDLNTQGTFSAGKPKVIFEGSYLPTPLTFANYDVSSDGQRFLMLKPTEQEQSAATQINVVLNWFEELKQKVSTGKK